MEEKAEKMEEPEKQYVYYKIVVYDRELYPENFSNTVI